MKVAKFLVSLKQAMLGWSERRQANPSSRQTHQKLSFMQTVKDIIMLNRDAKLMLVLGLGTGSALVSLFFSYS